VLHPTHAPASAERTDTRPRPALPDLTAALSDVVVLLRRASPGDPADRAAAGPLAHLGRLGPVRATALAENVCLDPSTVSRHLRDLETSGRVLRRPDPADRRAALLEVSPTGRDLVDATLASRVAVLDDAVSAWPRDDIATLTMLLRRLADALETS
jgi:DNA-binding MarR family transcriptional regulator